MKFHNYIALATTLALFAPHAAADRIADARFTAPVERYGHFALGQPHEYARVVATTDSRRELSFELPEDEVFEALTPRLVSLVAALSAD